jgi:hypothetical protein
MTTQRFGAISTARINNLGAAVDPAVTDDSTAGYLEESLWINTTAAPARVFVCIDPAEGAAVWAELTNPAASISPVDEEYTISNPTPTRSLDEATTTIDTLTKFVGTLATDLQTAGIIS